MSGLVNMYKDVPVTDAPWPSLPWSWGWGTQSWHRCRGGWSSPSERGQSGRRHSGSHSFPVPALGWLSRSPWPQPFSVLEHHSMLQISKIQYKTNKFCTMHVVLCYSHTGVLLSCILILSVLLHHDVLIGDMHMFGPVAAAHVTWLSSRWTHRRASFESCVQRSCQHSR